MNFHEQLFRNKGWVPGQGSTKVSVVSILRSDMTNQQRYCKGFYQDLTFTLNRLNLKRSNGSCDLDETSCNLTLSQPKHELSVKINDLIVSGVRPIIFYGESSPVTEKVIKEFAEAVTAKHNIAEYAIALIAKDTKDVKFILRNNCKKEIHFKFHNLSNKLEEV